MERLKRAQVTLTELKALRASFDPHWKQLQEFFLTRRGRWITDNRKNQGEKRNQKLVDPTPKFAARTLGAGMHAGTTNPSMPWFKLSTPDPEMMEFPPVARWLHTVENLMRDVFEGSNLYAVLPNLYTEAGVFGTAPMLMFENRLRCVHFVPKTVGSYYLATNSEGIVDTMYCEYVMTTRQLVEDYGIENVSSTVKNQWTNNQLQLTHSVLHVIEPNKTRRDSPDNQNMAFSSMYFELNQSDKEALKISGFEDNIIGAFRWETTELTDAYGSSCGMDALGCAQAMQVQQKRKAQAIDKHVDPPMVGDPQMKGQPSSLIPGDVTWAGFTATGSMPKFQPAYTIKPELQGLLMDIEDIRDLVEKAMYTDLFMAITKADPRNATVPEIDARKEEQILALGPVLQNHTDGIIKPIIDRTFNVMMRQGRIPPPPRELSGVKLKVELTGALAQAFKMIAANKIERFTNYVGSVAKVQADSGQEVTAFDKWDADQSIDEYAQAIGVPPSIVRGDDDVEEIRAERAEAQQAQQALAAAPALKDAAQAGKAMAETPTATGNALEDAQEALA